MKPASRNAVREKVPNNLRHAITAKPENVDDDGSDYVETDRDGKQSTVVPLEQVNGGTIGNRYSVYGKIIMGAAITKQGAKPLVMQSRIVRNAPSIFDEEAEEGTQPLEPEARPRPSGMQKEAAMAQQPRNEYPVAQIMQPPPVVAIHKQRIVMSGSFGRYSGNYVAWEDNCDQLVLISSIDDANFVPPVSEDPITIRIGDKTFIVQFAGTAFSLELFQSEVTVFKKHELSRELDGAAT